MAMIAKLLPAGVFEVTTTNRTFFIDVKYEDYGIAREFAKKHLEKDEAILDVRKNITAIEMV